MIKEALALMWWHNFCLAHCISLVIQDKGDKIIEDDPEYWRTRSMRALWVSIADHTCECGAALGPFEGTCASCRQKYRVEA